VLGTSCDCDGQPPTKRTGNSIPRVLKVDLVCACWNALRNNLELKENECCYSFSYSSFISLIFNYFKMSQV
jgi:hypothetical protein